MKLKFSANIIFYLKVFLVFLVFLIGVILRLRLFPTNNTWLGDIGRDMLAGHLIAFKGMSTQFGHYNSGIDFTYPSFYYYFIAFLTIIGGDNYENISKIIIIYQSLGIILVFLIAKNAFSYLPALIVSTFYSLSEKFISFSLMPISAHNSIPIILLSALFFQNYLKKRRFLELFISSFLLILAGTFFYGAMLLIPLFGLLILVKNDEKKSREYLVFSLLIFGLSIILFFAIFNGPVLNLDSFYEKTINSGFRQLKIDDHFFNELLIKNYEQFGFLHPNLTIFSLILYFLILIFNFFQKRNLKITAVFLIVLVIHAVLYAAHKNSLIHYYTYVHIIFLFILGYGLEQVLQKNKLFFAIFSIAVLISGNCFNNKIQYSNNMSYDHHKKASAIIANKFPQSSIIYVEDCSEFESMSGWGSRSFWYFQRENDFFILNNFNSQIELKNINTVLLCGFYKNEKKPKKPILLFSLDSKKYAVFN